MIRVIISLRMASPKNHLGIYELAFNSPEWDQISDIAKEILVNLLGDDQHKRMTSSQFKNHPWIAEAVAPSKPLPSVRGTIRSYRYVSFTFGSSYINPLGTTTKY
jgi:hypothetical protein